MSLNSELIAGNLPNFFVTPEIIQLEEKFIASVENSSSSIQQRVEKIAKLCLESFVTAIAFIFEGVWSIGGLRDNSISRHFVMDGAPIQRLPMTSFFARLVKLRWDFKPISDKSAQKVLEAARNLNNAIASKFNKKDSELFPSINVNLFVENERIRSYYHINCVVISLIYPNNSFTVLSKQHKEETLRYLTSAAKTLNQVPQNMDVKAQ